jgi:hypothetical protein
LKQKTAILLFTRSAEEEARFKKLPGPGHLVLKQLIDSTYDKAVKSGLPVECSSEKLQKGNSFGERLSNEIERVFSLGFENVIVIGNDSPGLSTEHLLFASEAIENKDLILGPSPDGGAFLIGIQKKAFRKSAFQNIQWESDAVFTDLLRYGHKLGLIIEETDLQVDIDTPKDLFNWLNHAGLQPLAIKIQSLLASGYQLINFEEKAFFSFPKSYKSLRAPPYFS